MKKWFADIKLRNKLNIIILISLISIIILGLLSHYFLNTSHVVSLMLNGERIHNVAYHTGAQQFYQYLQTKDQKMLDSAYSQLDKANSYSEIFSKMDENSARCSNKDFRVL